MFKPLTALLLACLGILICNGQDKGLSRADKKLLDSMISNDAFLQSISEQNKSFFEVNIGMGNGVFSQKNNTLNTSQSTTNLAYYTPSFSYFHKSGAALTVSANLVNDGGKLQVYQYAINPSYTYDDDNLSAGISYTWYAKGKLENLEHSPFQHDLLLSARYKRTWLEPGISVGYTTGKITEHFDTSFWIIPQPPLNPRIVHITDTITTRIRGFSLSASASHEWKFKRLFTKKDALALHPTFYLNAGSQKWTISHSSSLSKRRPIVQQALKSRYGDGTNSESFNLQSLAFSGEATYYFKRFYLQPQVYFDYYLPSSTDKRLTTLYAVLVGFSF